MSFSNNDNRSAENDSVAMESYPSLEAGVYRARVEKIENTDTKYGPALRFNWIVIGGDSDGERFDGLVNKKLLPKSKLATWAKAHLGVNVFPEGFVLKLSSLIGTEVFITLTSEPRNDGSGDRNVVAAVSHYKAATKKPKPSTPAAAQPADNGFTEAFEDIPEPDYPPHKSESRVEA